MGYDIQNNALSGGTPYRSLLLEYLVMALNLEWCWKLTLNMMLTHIQMQMECLCQSR